MEARMSSYARFEGAALHRIVGTNAEGGRVGDGADGYLSHGPYLNVTPGNYTAGFYVPRGDAFALGFVNIDVCCNEAELILASRRVPVSESNLGQE